MKGSKGFNNILDECLEQLFGGETIEQCLQSYPEWAAELKPLLQMALAVKKASTIQPRIDFKATARYQFGSVLQEVVVKRSRPLFGWLPRWATAVAVILILLLLGGGTVAMAGNSMPDGALYQVKLATEQMRLTLTPSSLGKAELCARLADKRVAEIIYMASKGDPEPVELVTQRLNTHLAMIASLAVVQGRKGGAVLAPAPVPERAVEETEAIHPQATGRDKLRAIVEHYAINHPARLRDALKTAPESVKPVLRRAIAVLVADYEKALEALD